MKNINNYVAEKYSDSSKYTKVDENIYKVDNGWEFVTSLTFEQEPELNEGTDASNISQYPLEDILDKFLCHVSDFYPDLNIEGSKICYIEFGSRVEEEVRELRSIIGKHVYNKEVITDGKGWIELFID